MFQKGHRIVRGLSDFSKPQFLQNLILLLNAKPLDTLLLRVQIWNQPGKKIKYLFHESSSLYVLLK